MPFLFTTTSVKAATPSASPTAPVIDSKDIANYGAVTGTVKWFNTTKGFGFIAPETGGSDVFVHISAVERSGLTGLADNQKVSYELQDGRDGRQMAGDLKAL